MPPITAKVVCSELSKGTPFSKKYNPVIMVKNNSYKAVQNYKTIEKWDFSFTIYDVILDLSKGALFENSQGKEKEQRTKTKNKFSAMLMSFVMLISGLCGSSVPVFAEGNDDTAKLSVTYHLNNEDGNMIAEPYYADMQKGSAYEVQSPEIENYVLKKSEQKTIQGILNEDTNIKVIYTYDVSKEVSYKINYIGVDSKGREITLETVTDKAPINTVISIPFKTFKGYHKRSGEDMKLTVTSDGKAEKNIYYDQAPKPYIIFNTNGSYIEPITVESGDDISDKIANIKVPTRQGYMFAGWDKELPTTMPYEDLIVNAKWEAGTRNYTVLYWFEIANDDNYTLGKNDEIRIVKTDTYIEADQTDIANGDNDKNDASNDFFGFNYSHCDKVLIKADGTSILNVYYDREIWKINYMNSPDGDGIWRTIEGKYLSYLGNKRISDEELKNYYGENFAYMSHNPNSYLAALLEQFVESEKGGAGYGEQNIFPYYRDEDIYKFQIRQLSKVPDGDESNGVSNFADIYQYTDIHMNRIKSNLIYSSNNEVITTISDVPYQKSIDLTIIPTNGEKNMKFAGWYYNPVLMNTETPLKSYTMPANDLTLYAKWEPVDRTVTFDTQGGASATKTITVVVKDKEDVKPVKPITPDKGDGSNTNKPDNKPNKGNDTTTSVKTEDSTNILLWNMPAGISLAGVITVLFFRRRRSR